MSAITTPNEPDVDYPDSDGMPMADNTLQFQWIVTIKENLDALFRDRSDVFVAGDNLMIYPVQGDNTIRQAPDVYVVFGRPKGHRGSYRVWEEGGTFPQVVFEILSPGNRAGEMTRKRQFYRRYGAEEYYVFGPDDNTLEGWLRQGNTFREVDDPNGWVSPRLGTDSICRETTS
jgi:Uma2 family endonuclease